MHGAKSIKSLNGVSTIFNVSNITDNKTDVTCLHKFRWLYVAHTNPILHITNMEPFYPVICGL